MAHPIYYVPAGDVLPIFFDSYDGGTGASITMTGLAVTDIEIYKDGSVTQRASDAGYTLLDTDGIDFDAITGIHGFSVDTGDNTDASFYTVGAWFTVVVSAITIDAQTVNFIAAQFRIMEAETTAGRPLVQTAALSANAITATAINADAITDAKVASDVTIASVTGAVGSVTGAVGSVTAAVTVGTINANVVTASALAADAVTEIQAGLATPTNITAGTITTVTNLTNLPATAALEATLASMKGATFAEATDSLEALRNRGDAAWITATGFATPTNITAGTITTVTNLTNAPTAGDLTATMKTSVGTAVAASAVASVTGNVGGNVAGSVGSVVGAVGSVTGAVGSVTGLTAADVGAIKTKTDSLTFTVAGQVDSNVQSINDVAITGNGQVGTEFGV